MEEDSQIMNSWKGERIFESEPDSREKFMITFPFPYVNGAMHIGHGYTFTRLDAVARYWRLKGKNVLFPFGFHATGEPIAGVAARLKAGDARQRKILVDSGVPEEEIGNFTEPVFIVNYWKGIFRETLDNLGGSIDWRRAFVTTKLTPTFSRFVEWQYTTLKRLGYVVQGTHPVIYCLRCQSPTGDHDRLDGEGASPQEFSILKFALPDGRILAPATLRPETIFGATSMFLNPDAEYVNVSVGKEIWVVSKMAAEKLSNQRKDVGEISETFLPVGLFGKMCKSLATGKQVTILPAKFVRGNHATGVVMSVPSHAPFDWVVEKDILSNPDNLEKYGITKELLEKSLVPVAVIAVGGYPEHPSEFLVGKYKIASQADEDLLQKATEEIYKKEHHSGKMLPVSGKYSGMPVEKAKASLKADFSREGVLESIWESDEPVVCRCGNPCIVKILENQWFLKFSDEKWKADVKKAISKMKFYPESYRTQFENTVDWLKDKACARRSGLGTPLPWDTAWIVETLSDSVIYMAYYTISHIIKEEKISPEDLTDGILDYVFRGVERPASAPDWADRMKASFEYWYPVDLRGSGKDLVQNHLTFYIFHHVALFPEKAWPIAITTNGYVNVEGEKMSKSKGNFVTLRDALEKYGADAVRFSLVYAAEEANDPDWRRSDAESFRQKIDSLVASSGEHFPEGKKDAHLDSWLEGRLALNLKKAEAAYSEVKTRTAIQAAFFDSLSDMKWYQKRGGRNPDTFRKFYRTIALSMSPVIPFASEKIWKNLGESGFAATSVWPSLKETEGKVLFGETLIARTLSDCREIAKIYKKDFRRIILFVAPDWKATIGNLVRGNPSMRLDELMKLSLETLGKENAQEISAFVQKIVQDPSKIPEDSGLSSADELEILSKASAFLSSELSGKEVSVELAEVSNNPKAKQALSGKPAILFE